MASVWGVSVFSVGSVYVFFRGGGVAVCAIDGRLMYAEGVSGPTLARGPAFVTFRNEFRVFYPLNFRQY